MPTTKKKYKKNLPPELIKSVVNCPYRIEQILDCGGYVNLDAIEEDIPEIFTDNYQELLEFLRTGQCSDEFREEFMETIDQQFDTVYLSIELLSEQEFNSTEFTKENIYNLTDWQERCGEYINIKESPFGFNTWKWGKLRFILSGFIC